MSGMFGFVLCADDFGLTDGVSRGILDLLEIGRLSATGAMTNRPHWPALAPELRGFSGVADIGVHLNLTCGAPLTAMPKFAPDGRFPTLGQIMTMAVTRRLPLREIAHELTAQIDAFELVLGRAPDFIDGHQHIHGLAGVQPVFLDVLARRYTVGARPYIRVSADGLLRIARRRMFATKAMQVRQLSRGFRKRLTELGFATNDGFAGFSRFDASADYAAQFATYLVAPGRRHLVMCHPGYVDAELPTLDPVIDSRERELAFLAGPAFAELLAKRGADIRRMAELSQQG